MSQDNKKPWGGRFQGKTHHFIESFTASVDFDSRLGEVDAICSQAHAKTLLDAEIITEIEHQQLVNGLDTIIEEIREHKFNWRTDLEDVHMNIESRLVELIGEPALKLHTARSRNDQVTSTFKVFLMRSAAELTNSLRNLQEHILDKASKHVETIMPGMTHLQVAQPIVFGHHLMAWFEMFDRDLSRLEDWHKRTNSSPMGVAALAGTSFPLNRDLFKETLGFDEVTRNSVDSVSDRDYAIEFVSVLSLLIVHLSRVCEEIVLWASPAFDLIDLPDELCTGSSIMPQKKNPDVAELIRGKSGRVIGSLMSLLVTLKGQPLAYNRDNQEDKEAVFDAFDTTFSSVCAMSVLIEGMEPKESRMYALGGTGYPTATDMADWLVRQGTPFRSAHAIVGRAVALAEEKGVPLEALSLDELKQLSDQFEDSVFACLTLEGSVKSRITVGGTAPDLVRQAIVEAREKLAKAES